MYLFISTNITRQEDIGDQVVLGHAGMTLWYPGQLCGCEAEWTGCILSIVLELEFTEPEVNWTQLERKVKQNPQVFGLYIWADGSVIYWNREHKKKRRFEQGVMCSALDHWFLDACGTSQQICRTQLQVRRESRQLCQSDKLCHSLFSAAREAS